MRPESRVLDITQISDAMECRLEATVDEIRGFCRYVEGKDQARNALYKEELLNFLKGVNFLDNAVSASAHKDTIEELFALCKSENPDFFRDGYLWSCGHGYYEDIIITPSRIDQVYTQILPMIPADKPEVILKASVLISRLPNGKPEYITETFAKVLKAVQVGSDVEKFDSMLSLYNFLGAEDQVAVKDSLLIALGDAKKDISKHNKAAARDHRDAYKVSVSKVDEIRKDIEQDNYQGETLESLLAADYAAEAFTVASGGDIGINFNFDESA